MPKTTTESDMIEYLETESDFAFELSVLNQLVSLGFQCTHGGSYEDPSSNRTRQFDIRAAKLADPIDVHFAVECKNLRDDFPLLVSCIPRVASESFHEVAIPLKRSRSRFALPLPDYSKVVRLREEETIYKVSDPVGKSCAQVGRSDNGRLKANDAEVFEKWAQALASASDLTFDALVTEPSEDDEDIQRIVIFPVLVVSPNNLWSVDFDADGNRLCKPRRTERVSMYVGKAYHHKMVGTFVASHLEVVTPRGLSAMVSSHFVDDAAEQLAPMDVILPRLAE
jgi:hypothetical protein